MTYMSQGLSIGCHHCQLYVDQIQTNKGLYRTPSHPEKEGYCGYNALCPSSNNGSGGKGREVIFKSSV